MSDIGELMDLQDVLVEVQIGKMALRDARRAYERAEKLLKGRSGETATKLKASVLRRLEAIYELEPRPTEVPAAIGARDERRLRDGAAAAALPELPERSLPEAIRERLDMLHSAICAMQSLDDLGSPEANAKAWSDMEALQERHMRLKAIIQCQCDGCLRDAVKGRFCKTCGGSEQCQHEGAG